MNDRDLYLSWLNDAYAMEKNVEEVLEDHSSQAKDFPDIQGKIDEHLQVTRSQADRVKQCIERNGGKVSSVKSGMANLMGSLTGKTTSMAKDRIVKNALADYAAENFEIASYTAIVDAANTLGDTQTAQVCQGIIQEEMNMAQWLSQNLPKVSNMVLAEAGD